MIFRLTGVLFRSKINVVCGLQMSYTAFCVECGGFKSILVSAQSMAIFDEMTWCADDLDVLWCRILSTLHVYF